MKIYKETIYKIEYDVIELEEGKYSKSELSKFTNEHTYTLFRRTKDGKTVKEMFFKDGKIHNEYGMALVDFRKSKFLFYLNGIRFDEEEEFMNELRKIRLDEII